MLNVLYQHWQPVSIKPNRQTTYAHFSVRCNSFFKPTSTERFRCVTSPERHSTPSKPLSGSPIDFSRSETRRKDTVMLINRCTSTPAGYLQPPVTKIRAPEPSLESDLLRTLSFRVHCTVRLFRRLIRRIVLHGSVEKFTSCSQQAKKGCSRTRGPCIRSPPSSGSPRQNERPQLHRKTLYPRLITTLHIFPR